MKIHLTLLLLFASSSLLVTESIAQVEFVDRMNKGFLSRKPEIGEEVKDVKVFDEAGNPFQLKKTRGKHTVLIFGCLT